MFQFGVSPWSRRRGSSCLTSDREGSPAWTSILLINYFLITIKNQQKRLARSLAGPPAGGGGHGPLFRNQQDLMQHSSPLLLPSRPNSNSQQHDDDSNSKNTQTTLATSSPSSSPVCDEKVAQDKRYVGRKRRKKPTTLQDKVADATRLLKEQIAKANIITTQSHGPSSFSRQQSPAESTSSGTGSRGRPQSPLSPTIPYDLTTLNETDSNSYATTTSLFTSSESSHHEPRLLPPSSPSMEVMDIASPPTTGVTEFSSSPSTAVTDYSSPPLGVGYSSPPLEAMGYYSPPPMDPDLSPLSDRFAEPPPTMDHLAHYPPPVHLSSYHSPSPQYQFELSASTENKIDWGSDSEEDDVEVPPPSIARSSTSTMDHTDSALVPGPLLDDDSGVLEWTSESAMMMPQVDDAQNIDYEDEPVAEPRTITDCEVDKLHNDRMENLNGNYDSSGSFREWHETLRVQTYGGEELLILPYTVIDF